MIADHDADIDQSAGRNYMSYLNQFIPPFENAKQYSANGFRNMF
jgi:hypothetical protein